MEKGKGSDNKFPFEVIDAFKIKSRFKQQLLSFSYEKPEDINNAEDDFLDDDDAPSQKPQSKGDSEELVLNLIFWKSSNLYLYIRDSKGGKITFAGAKFQLFGISPSGRYVIGMKPKGQQLILVDQRDRELEEYQFQHPISTTLKTKVVAIHDTGKLVIIYNFEGRREVFGSFRSPNKKAVQFYLTLDSNTALKPILYTKQKFLEQFYQKIFASPHKLAPVCIAIPKLYRESRFYIAQAFQETNTDAVILLLTEIDFADDVSTPGKNYFRIEVNSQDSPIFFKKTRQVLLRLEGLDNEIGVLYVETEGCSHFFFISFLQAERSFEYYRADSTLGSLEEFSFINVSPLMIVALTKHQEIAIVSFKFGYQLLQLIPMKTYSIPFNPSNDFIVISQEAYNTMSTKKAVIFAMDTNITIFSLNLENLIIKPPESKQNASVLQTGMTSIVQNVMNESMTNKALEPSLSVSTNMATSNKVVNTPSSDILMSNMPSVFTTGALNKAPMTLNSLSKGIIDTQASKPHLQEPQQQPTKQPLQQQPTQQKSFHQQQQQPSQQIQQSEQSVQLHKSTQPQSSFQPMQSTLFQQQQQQYKPQQHKLQQQVQKSYFRQLMKKTQKKPTLSFSSKNISLNRPIFPQSQLTIQQLVEGLWGAKWQRNKVSQPDQLISMVESISQMLSQHQNLPSKLALAYNEQLLVTLNMIAQHLSKSKSKDSSLCKRVFSIYDKIYQNTRSTKGAESQPRKKYIADEIQVLHELMSNISLNKLDLSTVFRLLRDKIWKLPTDSKIKPFSFFIVFDVLRQIWSKTLLPTGNLFYYSSISYFASGDLYSLVVVNGDSNNLLAGYRRLCVKNFEFEAKKSQESLAMPHFQGYNLFKCLLFLADLLRLPTELVSLARDISRAIVLAATEKFDAYLLLLSLNLDHEASAPSTAVDNIRKIFLPTEPKEAEKRFVDFSNMWKDFEKEVDQANLQRDRFLDNFVSIPLLMKMESDEFFLKYYLESYIFETHAGLKNIIHYFNAASSWSQLAVCLMTQMSSNDSIFFQFLDYYSNLLQGDADRLRGNSYSQEAKAVQYLAKMLVTFPLCLEYALQSLSKSKATAEKKIYKIFRLIFYIMTKVVETSLSPDNLASILACKLNYLFYGEFEKPHYVLQSVMDVVSQNADLAQGLCQNSFFLGKITGCLRVYSELIHSQPKFKILQLYAKNAEEKAPLTRCRELVSHFSTVRDIKAKIFEEYLDFLEKSPNYRKNKFSTAITNRHLEKLKQIKEVRDTTLSKFYQMFRLNYEK